MMVKSRFLALCHIGSRGRMELQMMAVVLKNLVVRSPQGIDWAAIVALVSACERVEHGRTDRSLEDLLSHWHRPDLHLAKDAWVIVTTSGEIVGFACVWHEEQALISTLVCVHPTYRNRGIGTLLLRLVEMWAREQSRLAAPGVRVILRGLLSQADQNEQRLFKREGYHAGSQFLRISFTLTEETGELAPPRLRAEGSPEHGRLFGMPSFYDRDGLCSVHVYRTYEKELCPVLDVSIEVEHGSDVLVGAS
jgi:GNAT superfamily N-acetyltransferase